MPDPVSVDANPTTQIAAHSISRSVSRHLRADRLNARVLAVFDHACDLVTPDGDVIALVFSLIGDGPLNIVLENTPGLFTGIFPDARVTIQRQRLRISHLEIDLSRATTWEPCPDWATLRTKHQAVASRLPTLRTACLQEAPGGSLLALLNQPHDSEPEQLTLAAARKATHALRAGWEGDLERLHAGAAGLAGLGSGLTPAGDDFLVGAMVSAWIAHPTPAAICRTIAKMAAPRTTMLSAALLRAAARGECSAAWHALLSALSDGEEAEIPFAARAILARGATSGADGLAGFLVQPWETS